MSADDFKMFIQRIELLTDYIRDEKPHCIIFAGDFNSRRKQWWPEDNEDHQGIALDEFIERNALFQLINSQRIFWKIVNHVLTLSSQTNPPYLLNLVYILPCLGVAIMKLFLGK